MLVLQRKTDESVTIHVPGFEPIVVTVVRIIAEPNESKKARIGFTAPKSVKILRTELEAA